MSRPKRFTNTQSLQKSEKNEQKIVKDIKKEEKTTSKNDSKKEKPASKRKKFPRISQIITEKLFISSLVTGILLFLLVLALQQFAMTWKTRQNIQAQRQQLLFQTGLWQNILQKYPGYRDGDLSLAVLSYQLGDMKQASTYVNDALSLDPGSEQARILEQIIQAENRTLQ